MSHKEAQELIDRYSGTGELRRGALNTGDWTGKEFITADKVIGYAWVDGRFVETSRFYITYKGKAGAHIVPVKP